MTINAIPNPSNSGALDQFLQPQSMVTPGALGALAMLGTNSLTGSFQSEDYYPIVALALSFLFGFAALIKSTSILEKCFYYMINSIIIFSVAAGTNKLGQQVQHASLPLPSLSAYAASRMNTDALASSPEHVQFFKEWFPNQQNQLKSDTPASRRPSPQNERDTTTPASRRPDPDQQNEPAPTAPASRRPEPNR